MADGTHETETNDAAASPNERVVMVPYLANRGDGVDGHYCIGRNTGNGYHEFWHEGQKKWCSAGSVFKLGKAP